MRIEPKHLIDLLRVEGEREMVPSHMTKGEKGSSLIECHSFDLKGVNGMFPAKKNRTLGIQVPSKKVFGVSLEGPNTF